MHLIIQNGLKLPLGIKCKYTIKIESLVCNVLDWGKIFVGYSWIETQVSVGDEKSED